MGVVKGRCEAEERDDGGDFVEQKKGGHMSQRSRGKCTSIFVEEARETAVEALDAGLRCWLDRSFIRIAPERWTAEGQ
jgi:hypothetical protein